MAALKSAHVTSICVTHWPFQHAATGTAPEPGTVQLPQQSLFSVHARVGVDFPRSAQVCKSPAMQVSQTPVTSGPWLPSASKQYPQPASESMEHASPHTHLSSRT